MEEAPVTGGLTVEEERRLIALLDKVEQPYSRAFFEALMRRIPAIAVECLAFRRRHGQLQILLTRRHDHPDDLWPNVVHFAGTVARVTDESLDAMVHRVVGDELGCVPVDAKLLYHEWRQGGGRAATLHLFYNVVIDPETVLLPNSRWYDVDRLSLDSVPDLLDHHRKVIATALTYIIR